MFFPAKYSDVLLPVLSEMLVGCNHVLDPFAGTGKLRQIFPTAVLLEIEYLWAIQAKAVCGNALMMPFADGVFDAVATSPTYANRMADHFTDHQIDKHYRRNTYRHALGKPLHPENSGQLQWGAAYRVFHQRAWLEVKRVLVPDGKLILNISDHIRNKKRVYVSDWHVKFLRGIGFELQKTVDVPTPRNLHGANATSRVENEYVFLFTKS